MTKKKTAKKASKKKAKNKTMDELNRKIKGGYEFRINSTCEFRVDGGGDSGEPRMLVGHAAVFDQLSEELWGFREIVKPGAFTKTLAASADVRALIDHDSSKLLGRTKSSTLELSEDKVGLRAQIELPDTTFANDMVESVNRGDLDGMSFGFRTIEDRWHTEDGEEIRELIEVELFDVSVVTFPAYPQTDVALRAVALECRSRFEERQVEASDFEVTPFADLPIRDDVEWNPDDDTDAEIIDEITESGENWQNMKDANLSFAPGEDQGGDPPTQANAYKLKIARMVDGDMTVVFSQLANRMGVINGARGGVDLPDSVRQAAFNHGLRYYEKLDVAEESRPVFERSKAQEEQEDAAKRQRRIRATGARARLVDIDNPI